MSVKIEILDYVYGTGGNLTTASSGSGSGFTAVSSTNVAWGGSVFGYYSNITSQSLVVGSTYNLSFRISNYTGTGDMGFSTSSGVPIAARFSANTNGTQHFTFVATSTDSPRLYGRSTNSGNIRNIVIKLASAIDWDNSVVGELDVTDTDDFPLALTFQISDFQNLTSTSGDYSKTFKIPATKNNNNILKHLYVPNIDIDNNLTNNKPCRVSFNNLDSLIGLIQVDGVGGYGETPSHYSCVFFGSNLSWASGLQDTYMNTIEWGADGESLKYNKYSIMATWQHEDSDNSSNSPIVYPITSYGEYNEEGINRTIQLLDTAYDYSGTGSSSKVGYYGFWDSGNSYETPSPVSDWRPSVFVKPTLDKIFAQAGGSTGQGYKINSAFMETDMFKKLVWLLPNFKYNNPDIRVLDYSVRSKFENGVSMTAYDASYPVFPSITEDGVQLLYLSSLSQNNNTIGNGIDKGDYYYNGEGREEVDIQALNLTVNLGDSYVDLANNYITIGEYGNYKISLNGLQSKLARGFKGGSDYEQMTRMNTRVNVEVKTVGQSSWNIITSGYSAFDPINSNGSQGVNQSLDASTGYTPVTNISIDRYFNKGDKIRLTLGVRMWSSSEASQKFLVWMFYKSTSISSFNIELNPVNVEYGQTYNLADVISPDYTQIDFIKGIAHAFNLQMTTDESTKTINIEPFDSFYKPYADAVDWTYKLDRSNETNDKWLASDLKRTLVFKYKSDNDDAKVKHRGIQFFDDIQDEYPYRETLPNTFKKGDSTFENPFFAGSYNAKDLTSSGTSAESNDPPYSSCLWTENVSPNDEGRPTKGDDFLPRLLYWNKYSPVSTFGSGVATTKKGQVQTWSIVSESIIADSTANTGVLSNIYPQATMLNRDSTSSPNLAYGNAWVRDYDDLTGVYSANQTGKGLYDTYYRNMIEMLKMKPRLRTVYIDLKVTDIVDLDFRKLVYIDGVYWRINRVADYMPNQNISTKVELIEWYELGAFSASAPSLGSSGTTANWGDPADLDDWINTPS